MCLTTLTISSAELKVGSFMSVPIAGGLSANPRQTISLAGEIDAGIMLGSCWTILPTVERGGGSAGVGSELPLAVGIPVEPRRTAAGSAPVAAVAFLVPLLRDRVADAVLTQVGA